MENECLHLSMIYVARDAKVPYSLFGKVLKIDLQQFLYFS